MPTITLTEEESLYLQNCIALSTIVATNVGTACVPVMAEYVLSAIYAGHHRSVLPKLAPERAAQIDAIMEENPNMTLEERKARLEVLADQIADIRKSRAN